MIGFFNTGLTQQQFLDQYWQKKPLLIRQAYIDFQSPITPDELAGLACEPAIESRLIEEQSQDRWHVTVGPLSEADFERLPETHWTLLVQDVDKHVPELAGILDPFRFIPDWRRDDLMISYAPEHGSVGPHTDGYDVFLLQAMGTRRWHIGTKPIKDAKLISGLELQILADFSADQSWDLQPGDILYLPPHFAHYGIALNDCMTFSIGFRAPSSTDLIDALTNTLIEQGTGSKRYSDSDLQISNNSSEIDADVVRRVKALLHETIDLAEPVLAQTLGRLLTETKPTLSMLASETLTELPTRDAVTLGFKQGNHLQRSPYHRFAWSRNDKEIRLYMAGESYTAPLTSTDNIILLAERTILEQTDWHHICHDKPSATILCQLIAEGGWYWAD